jgi:hypothetical protein
MPYVFRLPALFPWADLSVDEEFYRGKGALGAARDAGNPAPEGSDAEGLNPEGRESAETAPIRPWTIEAGEVARFLLRLSLNELGKSFLAAERFLRRGEFPQPPDAARGGIGGIYENGLKYRLYKKS